MAYITLEELTTVIGTYRSDLDTAAENVEEPQIEFASSYLDSLNWVGSRTVSTQANAWPRQNVPIDRFNTSIGYRDSLIIPTEIMLIVAELAIRYSLNPGITADSASGIAVTGVTLPDTEFDLVGDYIRSRIQPFLSKSGVFTRVN